MKFTDPSSNTSAAAAAGSADRVTRSMSSAADELSRISDELRRCADSTAEVQRLYDGIRLTAEGSSVLAGLNVAVGAELDRISTADGTAIRSRDAFRSFGRISDADAKRAAARSALSDALSEVGSAAVAGRARTENLDTLAAARAKWRRYPEWLSALDAMDQLLAHKAQDDPPEVFRKWLKRQMDKISDNGLTEQLTERQKSNLKIWTGRDGRTKVKGDLDAEWGEQVRTAVAAQKASLAARKKQAKVEFEIDDHLQAEACIELIGSRQAGHGRATVHLLYDADTLFNGPHADSVRETFGGQDLSTETLARHLCDANVRRLVLGNNGVPLAVGRKERTATEGQRSALRAMYPTCAWCEVPFEYCQVHHITSWTDGGKTNMDELIPLCNHHHHHVHEGRWKLKLRLPDRQLEIYRPDGSHWTTKPIPTRRSRAQAPKTRPREADRSTNTN